MNSLDNLNRLRIGVLLDSFEVSNWEFEMLREVHQSTFARIELVVLNSASAESYSPITNVIRRPGRLFYSLFRRLDRFLFRAEPDAFERRDASSMLADMPRLSITPKQTRFSDYFREDDLARVERYEIDVLLRLGFRILRGGILKTPRFGVWSLHHGDNRVNRGGPAGFWEVMKGHPITGALLQVLTEELDDGLIIARTYSATDRTSVNRNRNAHFWKSLAMVPRALADLHGHPRQFLERRSTANREQLNVYDRQLSMEPGNFEMVGLAVRHAVRLLKRKMLAMFYFEQWSILFKFGDGISIIPRTFKALEPPRDRFWADPHVVSSGARHFVFIEEFLYSTEKGHISVVDFDDEGTPNQPRLVLERPFHLSYPYVFTWQGVHYMIPETSANRTIEVYRCERFPDQWRFHKTLMEDVLAFDATVFEYESRWWLAANLVERPGVSDWDELFLFSATNPLSEEWVPHACNPVVSDVRCARPAGRIFEHEGQVLRPAQDSSRGYGYGVRLQRIVTLTATQYEEEETDRIEPRWDRRIEGVHTFSHSTGLTAIDVRQKRLRVGR